MKGTSTAAPRRVLVALGLLVARLGAAESPAVPVRDFVRPPGENLSLSPREFLSLSDRVLFWGNAPGLGIELYRTDGTAEGTSLVSDLCPGECHGYGFGKSVMVGGRAIFFANDGARGVELWSSDGTRAGTRPLLDLAPGPEDGLYEDLLAAGDRALFRLYDFAFEGWELWSTDGTEERTAPFARIGSDGSGISVPPGAESPMALPGGRHLYLAVGTTSGTEELWEIDGTASGSRRVRSLRLEAGERLCSEADDFPRVDSGGILIAIADSAGCEPWWVADGVATRLADLAPGEASSAPRDFIRVGSLTYFAAYRPDTGSELWRTDGTAQGTRLISDATPGPADSTTVYLGSAAGLSYFAIGGPGRDLQLWSTTGAPGSLRQVSDRRSEPIVPARLGTLGDVLFFASRAPGDDMTLWAVGADGAVRELIGTRNLASPFGFVGGRAVFGADLLDGRGFELASSDGTPAGTVALGDLVGRYPASAFPEQLVRVGDRLLFTAQYDRRGREVWRTDGTSAGTELVADLIPPSAPGFSAVLLARTATGVAIQSYDGSIRHARARKGGADLLIRPAGEFPDATAGFTLGGRALFFLSEGGPSRASLGLWSVDGLPKRTRKVAEIARFHPNFGYRLTVAVASDRRSAFFLPENTDGEVGDVMDGLWRTDGTKAGTRRMVDVPCAPCTDVRVGEAIVGPGERVFYVLADRGLRFEQLWVSDGTADGTVKVLEVPGELDGGTIHGLARLGNLVLFAAFDPQYGEELWRSDGSIAGTRRLADLRPGAASSAPSELTRAGSLVYFAADDGTTGRELWATDGTAEGTRRLGDLFRGRRSSNPQQLAAIGPELVFAADDGRHGLEVWSSDGTGEGTALLSDVEPGRLPSNPRDFLSLGSDLLFTAARLATGRELFRLPLSALFAP